MIFFFGYNQEAEKIEPENPMEAGKTFYRVFHEKNSPNWGAETSCNPLL